ncbi:hypothetical protein Q7C36_019822 [Tachysurus vachellii]|uniref:Uncharacterized protein n=1 Tax=Tachysurus vachellii TaxID=175792 RepID=A0AA88LSG9_TACVA|nr:hypothetical protein Q7C36_019822 [Tachysurus vachellii]
MPCEPLPHSLPHGRDKEVSELGSLHAITQDDDLNPTSPFFLLCDHILSPILLALFHTYALTQERPLTDCGFITPRSTSCYVSPPPSFCGHAQFAILLRKIKAAAGCTNAEARRFIFFTSRTSFQHKCRVEN